MNNQKIKNIAFWVMIGLVVSLGIYLVFWLKTESFQCLSNPYVYSIKLLEKANGADVSAVVSIHKPNSLPVLLTRNGFEKIEVSRNINESNVNKYNFTFAP